MPLPYGGAKGCRKGASPLSWGEWAEAGMALVGVLAQVCHPQGTALW